MEIAIIYSTLRQFPLLNILGEKASFECLGSKGEAPKIEAHETQKHYLLSGTWDRHHWLYTPKKKKKNKRRVIFFFLSFCLLVFF
jgi:hypothetical protein